MKRKLFTFLLAAVASVGLTRAEKVKIGDLYYELFAADNSATVTYQYYAKASNYSNLTMADIPASVEYGGETYDVKSIGAFAFYKCSSLTSVTIGDSVTSIGSSAFDNCSGLTSVTIGNNVTSIGSVAFYGCRNLTSVTMGSNVTSIGYQAFLGCNSLTSVTIPESVTSIGSRAFEGVLNVIYSGTATGSPWGAKCLNGFVDGWIVYNDSTKTQLRGCFAAAVGEIIIPESVTSIGSEAFNGCNSLTSVVISENVTSIGNSAFFGCSSLASMTIPESVTSIGVSAFYNCSSLTSIIIPNSITSIQNNTFYNCTNLASVTLGSNVRSIGDYAFHDCKAIKSITIPKKLQTVSTSAFPRSRIDSLYYKGTPEEWNGKSWNIFLISENYNLYIGDSLLTHFDANCNNQYSYSVGQYAFYGCKSLTSVNINGGRIGESAFYGCSNLAEVNMTEVNGIMESAFSGCSKLNNIVLPDNITYLADHVFSGCASLSSIIIPENVTRIADGAFSSCGLTSIVIPNNVTKIEDNSRGTDYTTGAFASCSRLTSVVLGSGLQTIGKKAFKNCSALKEIISLKSNPPAIEWDTFRDIPSDAIVYVPFGSTYAYRNAQYWKNENIRIKCDEDIIVSPTCYTVTFSADVFIDTCSIVGGETVAGNTLELIGLEPETEYNKTFALTSNIGETDTINVSFTTTALELTTQQPSIVSSSMAILLAETNMADAEVNCGFEWRRDNQPEAMASTKVYAPVANGVMAGRLKGLKDDVYYKYRAFYESTAGNTYYGDWQYIFTGDNTVEFDPVMYTYPTQRLRPCWIR